MRMQWGNKIRKDRNIDVISKYADYNQRERIKSLTPQTLKDIDIENLFAILDRTLTTVGQQLLYYKILFFENNLEKLKKSDENSTYFKEETAKRETVQIILYKLEKNGTSEIADLLNITKFRN